MAMDERRPRPSDFDEAGDYYTALMGWLARRYPGDQAGRINKWRAIERKASMPIKRVPKTPPKTALELAADRELNEMFERAPVDNHSVEGDVERATELIALTRPLTADEAVEARKIARRIRKRWQREQRRRVSRERFAKAQRTWATRSLDPAWRAKWDDEAARSRAKHGGTTTAEDSYVVWKYAGGAKGERKRQTSHERSLAAIEAERAAYASRIAAAKRVREQAEGPLSPAHASAPPLPVAETAPAEREARLRPRKPRYGIVAQYDAQGRRVT